MEEMREEKTMVLNDYPRRPRIKKNMDPNRKFFKGFCRRCGKIYEKSGRYSKICPDCYIPQKTRAMKRARGENGKRFV